jgi:small subunit ribosomal protein S6
MDSIHAIITTNGGNIVKTDVWGVKEFAYEIENMTKGFYVVTTFEAENAALNEFNRLMRINKNVVRFLTIKQEA